MQNAIQTLRTQFQSDIASVKTTQDLEALKVKFLGKKGSIQDLMKTLKDALPDRGLS